MLEERIIREITDLMQIVYRINRSFSHNCMDDDFALPPGQLHALIAIRKQQPLNMTQLADHLLMTRQQLTKVVDSLVERGFVRRGTDPENRRLVILTLSDAGTAYVKQLIYDQPHMLQRLLETLDEYATERFLEAIEILKEVLSKLDSPPKAK